MWYEALPVIGWMWVGIMIGTLFGVIVAGILAGSKQADLETEVIHLRAIRESLKEEIIKLESKPKPTPRRRRKRNV
jgi:hypothetical protein